MLRVIVESPYAGDIVINEIYGELAMQDCLINYNESPYASHLLYTRKFVLHDDIPKERKLGIKAGFFWRNVADKTVFYADLGMTDGMNEGIRDCKNKDKLFEVRYLTDDLWDEFEGVCISLGYKAHRQIERSSSIPDEVA